MTKRGAPLFFFFLALSMPAAETRAQPAAADLVLRDARIYTVDATRRWAEAVAVRDGEIVFVGNDTFAGNYIGPETRVLELRGRMVLPGFHDSHVHPVTGGIELGQCNLNGLTTQAEIFQTIRDFATRHPRASWITGGGWDLPIFEGGHPRREALDRLVPDRPAYLSAADGHSAWVNSRALEIAGIDRDTKDPPNGRIERNPETGEPTGTLREDAMDLVEKHLPALSPEDYAEGLRRGLEMANRFGITSWIEASAKDEVLEAYRTLSRSGQLTAKVRVSLWVDPLQDESQVDRLLERRRSARGPRLRADSAKIFADGVIEAGTAALLEPYVSSDDSGELNFEPERLDRIVARLDREGFQVHVHAIGDRAIRVSLDALEHARTVNGSRDARHHIAHIQLFDPEDIPRFRRLGVIANFQPLWAYADTYITDLTEPVLGPERSRWLYPIRSLADTGAVLVGGSDWSVSSMNPLDAIQVATTRRALDDGSENSWIPRERAALATMIAAYTINGAYLQHQEHRTGSIETGKAADLIVLEKNLFEASRDEIHRVRVLLTLLDGEEVFRHADF